MFSFKFFKSPTENPTASFDKMAKDHNFSDKCIEWLSPLITPKFFHENDLLASEGSALNNTVLIVPGGLSLINLESNQAYHSIDCSPYLVGHFESLFTKTDKQVFSMRINSDGYLYQMNGDACKAFSKLYPAEYQRIAGDSLDAFRGALVAKLIAGSKILTFSDYENKFKRSIEIKDRIEELKNQIR